MPIIGFGLIGVGGIFIYAGYLGYTPAKLVKSMLDGTLSTLPKIPIDPTKRPGYKAPGLPTNPQGQHVGPPSHF